MRDLLLGHIVHSVAEATQGIAMSTLWNKPQIRHEHELKNMGMM